MLANAGLQLRNWHALSLKELRIERGRICGGKLLRAVAGRWRLWRGG